MMKVQAEIQEKLAKATTDEEKAALNDKLANASIDLMLRVLWTTMVVDITATLQETTQMVFFDTSVTDEVRLRRVAAVKVLGSNWMNLPEPTRHISIWRSRYAAMRQGRRAQFFPARRYARIGALAILPM